MSRKIIESQNNDLLFRIREDLSEGKTYLTISKRNGSLINETIKDSELACKEFAFENYKIPFNSWREMKFQIHEAEYDGKVYIIEESYPEVGAYLYISENGKWLPYDSLQDNIEICKKFAFKYFQVPLDKWVFKGYK